MSEFNPWDCYPYNTPNTRRADEAQEWRKNVKACLYEGELSTNELQSLLLHILEYPELLR